MDTDDLLDLMEEAEEEYVLAAEITRKEGCKHEEN